MELAQEVKTFSSACEHILAAIAQNRPLTADEAAVIKYYCGELQAKVEPLVAEQIS